MNKNNSNKGKVNGMKNPYIITAIAVLVVGASAFYAGIQYQLRQKNAFVAGSGQFTGRRGNIQSGIERNGTFQGRTGDGMESGMGQGQNFMRPLSGEIINQDETSLTIKLPDGSTKIILLSDQTNILKTAEAATADLATGDQVTIFGTTNADGSTTAENVSIGNAFFRNMMGQTEQATSPAPAEQK